MDLEPSRTNIAHSATTQDPIAMAPPDSDSSFQAHDQDGFQPSPKVARQSSYVPPSSPSNISPQPKFPNSYPSNNLHIPPSTNNSSENSFHQQSYYQPEPQHHFSQHYPSDDVPSYSHPNFQSYPSFTVVFKQLCLITLLTTKVLMLLLPIHRFLIRQFIL